MQLTRQVHYLKKRPSNFYNDVSQDRDRRMNRIKISPLVSDTLCQSDSSVSCSLNPFQEAGATTADDFSLFVPMHYEKNYSYPLIVWLHSDGESADQVQQVMLEMSMRNYVGIAPQSPNGNREIGRYWDQDYATLDSAHQAVDEAIDLASMRFNIAHQRIFLAGMGAGGTMAFRLAFARPDLFAGVMSINGPIPVDHAPLRDWSRCRQMPVFWAHGRQSEDFGQDQLCEQLKLLHVAGFSVTLRQYPKSDLLCQKTMADMDNWVMEMISTSISDKRES